MTSRIGFFFFYIFSQHLNIVFIIDNYLVKSKEIFFISNKKFRINLWLTDNKIPLVKGTYQNPSFGAFRLVKNSASTCWEGGVPQTP